MRVVSLFDGIACAMVALERAGIPVSRYYASETDKFARQVAKNNYPDIVELGDVTKVSGENLHDIDLLIGGSPCQDLSISKQNRQGLEGKRSGLFWEYVRLLEKIKPMYFILENVASMPKKDKAIITQALGVEPVIVNAALVSAQQRKRLFWVGEKIGDTYRQVVVPQPEDRHIYLKDILEDGFTDRDKSLAITATYYKASWQNYIKKDRQMIFTKPVRIWQIGKVGQADRIYSIEGKSVCLSANGGGRVAKIWLYKIKDYVRKLTPIECERLQGLDDNYTEGISNTQRYKCLGNAFNVDVVAHILKVVFNDA